MLHRRRVTPPAPTRSWDKNDSSVGRLPEEQRTGNRLSRATGEVPDRPGSLQPRKDVQQYEPTSYFPANSYDPHADWCRSDNDQRHKFDMLATVEAGQWFNFGTALSLYSGKPVDITTGNDDNRDGLAIDRPRVFLAT